MPLITGITDHETVTENVCIMDVEFVLYDVS